MSRKGFNSSFYIPTIVLFVFIAVFSILLFRDQRSKARSTTAEHTAEQSMKVEMNMEDQKKGSNFAVVRVLFATDRNQTSGEKPSEPFGSNRAAISYGHCDVSIPRDHRMGELETPSVWRFEFHQDPTMHVVLLGTIINTKDEFFGDLAARVKGSKKSSAFLFIHGYNVTFKDAARRTAQFSYDLGFDGAPTFYSWPSQGSTMDYIIDEQNIEWTQTNFKIFLNEFFIKSTAQNIYLIAHSMGNRAMTRAVASLLTEKPEFRSRLREVILAAPDVDADVFKKEIAPALATTGRPVTLYASSEDLALRASKKIHGYPRAGDSGQGLLVVPGVETIDASKVDTSLIGHSYFSDNLSVLSDMYYLIDGGKRADHRFRLRRIATRSGAYWEFKQ